MWDPDLHQKIIDKFNHFEFEITRYATSERYGAIYEFKCAAGHTHKSKLEWINNWDMTLYGDPERNCNNLSQFRTL
jgi:hypothetical protein